MRLQRKHIHSLDIHLPRSSRCGQWEGLVSFEGTMRLAVERGRMTYLLLPGRQIVNTQYQETYLAGLLGKDLATLPELIGDAPEGAMTDIVFAVTSCNKSNSRYNPVPFEIRAILVYEFVKHLAKSSPLRMHIAGIPHYKPTDKFASMILKEITEQSDGGVMLTPQNTVVFTSTPGVIKAYRELGFAVLPGEYDANLGRTIEPTPNEIVAMIGEGEVSWEEIPLAISTREVFTDLPGTVERITRLFHDPILTEQGDLTETRNYSTYAREMANVVDLKYNEIKDFLLPGKIIDEGCADGVLIERIAQDYPDSDLIGVDLSAEMLARASEAQRAGAFGNAFVFFKQQNLMTPISDAQAHSVDTIICNSTLHELWSYGERDGSVKNYLRSKIKQLKPGGRLVIRDVVGPEQGDRLVHLWCNAGNGAASGDVTALSTRALFARFVQDFLPYKLAYTVYRADETSDPLFRLSLRDAMEFITKMSYTDNWASEMHEQFCFWNYSDWVRELTNAGFSVIPESHAYANPWRVEHQFQGRAALFDESGTPISFPVTNMVLIGEKPIDLPD